MENITIITKSFKINLQFVEADSGLEQNCATSNVDVNFFQEKATNCVHYTNSSTLLEWWMI